MPASPTASTGMGGDFASAPPFAAEDSGAARGKSRSVPQRM